MSSVIAPTPATILIVDDEFHNRKLLEMLLRTQGYLPVCANNGAEALAAIASAAPDLILLDVMMPDMDGYQLARLLKARHQTASIPIIMVTALNDRNARLSGLAAGVEEFLSKPVDRAELWLRVRNLLRLKAYGDLLRQHGILLEQQVHVQAHYDSLTGLPNRLLFNETLVRLIDDASGTSRQLAILFIALDHFKNINETAGRAGGDAVLTQFSKRLVHCAGAHDTVARLGGDEFAWALNCEGDRQNAVQAAYRIRDMLRTPFVLGAQQSLLTASVGIALLTDDASDAPGLLQNAETAMHQANQAGGGTHRFFTPRMNLEVLARLDLETALRTALSGQEFLLHYQPKVHIGDGSIAGLEALLRWQRPGHGLISPGEFIPVLEETGLIVQVGAWVIDAACRQIAAWVESAISAVPVSVNVSARQLLEGDLHGEVKRALDRHGVSASLLEVEITESAMLANSDRTVQCLNQLKRRGVRISLDDFGTGYSSLAYLRRFPIDRLKIDMSFIRDVTSNPDAAAIALAIVQMAHSLNLDVVAEGVETEAQLGFLRHYQCDQIQGHLFSPALPAVAIERLLRTSGRTAVMAMPKSPAELECLASAAGPFPAFDLARGLQPLLVS